MDKAKAEEKLEAARPALEEAESALQTIKPAHIATGTKLLTFVRISEHILMSLLLWNTVCSLELKWIKIFSLIFLINILIFLTCTEIKSVLFLD